MPELRKDPIHNRWVIVSKERAQRPDYFTSSEDSLRAELCPFCPGNEKMTPPEVLAYREEGTSADEPGWSLRVIPNKYPALNTKGEAVPLGSGLLQGLNGIGSHEVIIEHPYHMTELEHLPESHIADCFRAFKERLADLKSDPRLQHITIFKNHGKSAGTSQEHTHSQLIALPVVPNQVTEQITACKRHHSTYNHCIYCTLIDQERSEKRRIVAQNESFIAFCPYASRYSFEITILPLNHCARFENSSKQELSALAELFKESLTRMRRVLNNPPYNFILHTAPVKEDEEMESIFHWHLEIMPQLTALAGIEKGTGLHINTTLPEEATETLRNAIIE